MGSIKNRSHPISPNPHEHHEAPRYATELGDSHCTPTYNQSVKLDFPKFDGDNPAGWVDASDYAGSSKSSLKTPREVAKYPENIQSSPPPMVVGPPTTISNWPSQVLKHSVSLKDGISQPGEGIETLGPSETCESVFGSTREHLPDIHPGISDASEALNGSVQMGEGSTNEPLNMSGVGTDFDHLDAVHCSKRDDCTLHEVQLKEEIIGTVERQKTELPEGSKQDNINFGMSVESTYSESLEVGKQTGQDPSLKETNVGNEPGSLGTELKEPDKKAVGCSLEVERTTDNMVRSTTTTYSSDAETGRSSLVSCTVSHEDNTSTLDDGRWSKSPGPFRSGQDLHLEIGHGVTVVGFQPCQGGNLGVLRNPCAHTPAQYVSGILSGPVQFLSSQGGIQQNNLDADQWQCATGIEKGVIPYHKLSQVLHKAEKKYEVGKVSNMEEAKQRQLRAILNKLTPQNFDKLFEQVKEFNTDNAVVLTGAISQFFDNALTEPTFCVMWANFCYFAGELPDFREDNEKISFKRLLVNKCQEEFERGQREQAEANRVEEEGEIKWTEEERKENKTQARRRMLGSIKLIGELYKTSLLTERLIHYCIKTLLGQYPNPHEEDIEALCKLMSTIGELIDHPKAKKHMDAYFVMMTNLSNHMKLSSRVRFMLKDTIDLRKNKWQQKRKVEGPKKMEEVHRDASQGGIQRNNLDADWRERATGIEKRVIPSQKLSQVMHKAKKKYEMGKVSNMEEAKQRQLRAILNKLTPQNFEKLFERVKEVCIDNVVTLDGFTSQIYDRALIEPIFCEIYVNFCFHLSVVLPVFSKDNEKITFKRLILNKCQEEFERGERQQADTNRVEEGEKRTEEEREEKKTQERRRMLGNIRFLGELYKKKMLTERIMHECIKKLLGLYQNPEEEDIEALCKLMSTIGEMIDHPKAEEHMDAYFDMMKKLSNNMKLSYRVRLILKDAIDLRKNKWQQKRKVEGPKKIEQVHRDATQERQEQANRLGRGSVVRCDLCGSTMLSSPNAQMGGFSGLPSQASVYGAQDFGLEDRNSYKSRTLSVPLLWRPIEDDSIAIAPQGGLARRMSIGGQPLVSSVPVADISPSPGDTRRTAAVPNGYSSIEEEERGLEQCPSINLGLRRARTSSEDLIYPGALIKIGTSPAAKWKVAVELPLHLLLPLTHSFPRIIGTLGDDRIEASDSPASGFSAKPTDSSTHRSTRAVPRRKVEELTKMEEVHRDASQGGLQRNNVDGYQWQCATGIQKGLITSPQTLSLLIHKAEKKYEVGTVSNKEEVKQRQLKAILNKLTPQNFDKLFEQVIEVNVDNAVTLTGFISHFFEKALTEPTFCEMWARFCYLLAGELRDFSEDNEKITFKRLLLHKCQEEFERGEREQAEANRVEEDVKIKWTEDEREEEKTQVRRRRLGYFRLIGELYKRMMLTERLMHECIKKLLGQYQNPEEQDTEALCKLVSTVEEMIDHPKAKEYMDAYFDMMTKLSNNMKLSSRMRFMLKDVIDLRKNKWQPRWKVERSKKIEEVHRDASKEGIQRNNLDAYRWQRLLVFRKD
ncbi:hypothetical protein HHK36_000453 [Tetracentron sinense]|uniref:MIF4G domain-containing protein n=1 Tax=Tetracentron sinense TaxID=13715 RepID=A0A835DR14_TETSI|nr:hypothetical protein HHK36_000453 [Tetracentron sinense]